MISNLQPKRPGSRRLSEDDVAKRTPLNSPQAQQRRRESIESGPHAEQQLEADNGEATEDAAQSSSAPGQETEDEVTK
ncbi:hypothetical protein LTR05_004980 [Lithohypha guttulata]|uniref:Uncharacterized protein n=1 Tax=Lithohypha guttulata TaxID=1690604 RepID=A0AAN7SZK1_9EURO|nr:hypothetical protein LTR05_004980 [Lithohypha guttulata]